MEETEKELCRDLGAAVGHALVLWGVGKLAREVRGVGRARTRMPERRYRYSGILVQQGVEKGVSYQGSGLSVGITPK